MPLSPDKQTKPPTRPRYSFHVNMQRNGFRVPLLLFILCGALLFQRCSPQNTHVHVESSTDTFCIIDTPYPAWFFNPPPQSITGYFYDTTDAVTDARARAAGYRNMRVHGTFRFFEEGKWDDFQDSIRFYYNIPDTAAIQSLHIADSFFICCSGYLYLMTPASAVYDTTRVNVCEYGNGKETPQANRIYAYGEYRFEYYNQYLSWMHAEEEAVKQLCSRAAHQFASLTKQVDHIISATIMKRFDLTIQNIAVEKRTFDSENRICRVVVSCDTADIFAAVREDVKK